MSYWTYSDLFEEPGPPPTPFHGGFGLLNREGIRKPAYFAYKYLHELRGDEIDVQDSECFRRRKGCERFCRDLGFPAAAAQREQSSIF